MICFDSIQTVNDVLLYLNQFLEKYNLQLDELKQFKFEILKTDNEYGCPGRSFDYDDTNLARVIYYIIWNDLPEMELSEIGTGKKYRGDTLNTFNTVFSNDLSRVDLLSNDNMALHNKAEKFKDICYSLGNFSVLPNHGILMSDSSRETTINLFRGSWIGWKDFYDRFLKELNLCLLGNNNANPDLDKLVKENNFYFRKIEKIHQFITINFLESYFDEQKEIIKELFIHDFYKWKTAPDAYIAFANNYIDVSTEIINYRAEKMIDCLKDKIVNLH